MKINLLFVLVVLLFSFSRNSTSQTLKDDSLALVDFYNSTGGNLSGAAGWKTKTNWLTGKVSSWYGVTVSGGRVTTVSLVNNNLTGRITDEFSLSSLRGLNIRNNSLTELNISNLPDLETLIAYSNKIDTFITNTTPGYYPNLKDIQLHYNSFPSIDISNMPSLYNFTVAYNSSMAKVITNPNIGFYSSLYSFSTGYTGVTSLDIKGMRTAEWLTVQGCKLQSIDLSGFSNLKILRIFDNFLAKLDVSDLSSIEVLQAYNNKLSEFITNPTPSYYSKLVEFQVQKNLINTLNISNFPAVQVLYAFQNRLTDINTNSSSNYYSNLTDFRIHINDLSSVDISNMPALKTFNCSYSSAGTNSINNNLTSLSVNTTPNYYYQIENVQANFASLSSVELSGMRNLKQLNICQNKLQKIDISSNPNLELLYAYQNRITEFITSDTPNFYSKLHDFRLHGNDFSTINISNMPALKICFLFASGESNLNAGRYIVNGNFSTLITNNNLGYYFQIENLQIGYSALQTVDLAGMQNLKSLNIIYSNLNSIDISTLSKIEVLIAYQNKIKNVITSNQTNYYEKLYDLRLQANDFSKIDISNMPALKTCFLFGSGDSKISTGSYLINNNFTELITNPQTNYYYQIDYLHVAYSALNGINLSGMNNLRTFSIAYSSLKTLDISSLPNIETCYANHNKITEVITNTTVDFYSKLFDLRLNENDFFKLDISNMPALKTCYLHASSLSKNNSSTYYRNENFKELVTNSKPNYYYQIDYLHLGYTGLESVNLAGMQNLKTLSVGNSKFSSLDLTAANKIVTLYLLQNRFTFEDLEPLVSRNLVTYQYSPQANVNLFYNPSTFTFSVKVGGANNQYQWKKKGTNIPGATSSSLIITPTEYSENAQYQCVITNTVVTGLTLNSVIKRPQDSFTDLSSTYYISKSSGNWNDNSTWQLFDGSGYIDAQAGEIPGENNPVYLQAGHTVTLNSSASCKDLHLNTTADLIRLNIGENTLDVYGKIRSYTGSVPGINSTSAGVPSWITTGMNGRIRLKGTTNRAITEKDEFSDHENLKGWTLECDLSEGVIGTINSNFRAGNVIITSGSLEVKSKNFKVSGR